MKKRNQKVTLKHNETGQLVKAKVIFDTSKKDIQKTISQLVLSKFN